MDIIPGQMYWMQAIAKTDVKIHKKRASVRKFRPSELVQIERIESGTDKIGDYIRVSYILLHKGTRNSVKSYLTGSPGVNFIFTEVL